MRTELVSIATDTRPLDGALYTPEDGPVRGGILLFHGTMERFYNGPSRWLPPRLVDVGFACLAFNRRGHDILTSLEGKEAAGGAYQTAAEGIADNEYAAEFLRGQGFERFAIIGHSNGGMLGAEFAATHPEVLALVLLSAHAGGPRTFLRSCETGKMAGDQAEEFIARARELVADGRGDELLFLPNWTHVISAASLVDRHENTPDLLENAGRISCPSLFVVGSVENPEIYPGEAFVGRAAGSSELQVVDDAGHWYRGHEGDVAERVAVWLDATLRG